MKSCAATRLGFVPLTVGYHPDEGWMLENVLRDFRGSGRLATVLRNDEGLEEVWVEPLPGLVIEEDDQ